jgi:hypothetical protein
LKAVTHAVHRPRPETIRVWTIQSLHIWEQLREQQTLLADPSGQEFFQEFRASYDWMRGQMRRRLPEYDGHYPWWAYEHKPDLRHHQVTGPGQFARLELAVPPERVLLSAYGAWHYVLNLWYLPQAVEEQEYEREGELWDEVLRQHGIDPNCARPLSAPWHSRMTASWERIFDVNDLRETNTIQVCFERLNLDDVVRVTIFTPRPQSRNDLQQRLSRGASR